MSTDIETPRDYIHDIHVIRRINNDVWMDILRLAIKHAPSETRALLQEVLNNDRRVSNAMEGLVNDLAKTLD